METPQQQKKETCCCLVLSKKIVLFIRYVIPPVLGLFGDISDISSDFVVASRHYVEGKVLYFWLTLGFVFAPSLLFAVFMLYKITCNGKLTLLQKFGRISFFILVAFFLSVLPIFRYLKLLFYGTKIICGSDKKDEYAEKIKILSNDANYKLQVTLHAFLESAPQFLLQLFILLRNPPTEQSTTTVVAQIISIALSLNSLTNVVLAFHLDSKHHPKSDMDKCFVPIEYLWWFFSIGSRIIALAFFAAVFKYWVILVCVVHAAVMSAFIMVHQEEANFGDRIVAVFVGLMYIFCFAEYKVDFAQLGRVVALYVLYYIFTFFQNATMVLCSYLLAGVRYDFHLIILVLHFVGFFLAICFMLCYLVMLRPVSLKVKASDEKEILPMKAVLQPYDDNDRNINSI